MRREVKGEGGDEGVKGEGGDEGGEKLVQNDG